MPKLWISQSQRIQKFCSLKIKKIIAYSLGLFLSLLIMSNDLALD